MHHSLHRARRATALVPLFLALLAWPAPPRTASLAPTPITGRGWADGVVCVGCLVGAVGIASGGAATLITALRFPGGSMILAGCVAACVRGAA